MNALGHKLALLALVGFSTPCLADIATSQRLQKTLSQQFPELKIQAVNEAIVPGLYEVITTDEIIYSDASGKHIILGKIMDASTRDNLIQQRWNELNKIDFNGLPFDKAIKIVKGDGSRKLAVFADPLCPYCKMLENNLKSIDNVTVYVFLYPLESIHPGATEAAQNIWCSADRSLAWTQWMMEQKEPAENACPSSPMKQLTELGVSLKINSTPTLVFINGSRQVGALAVDKLEARLSEMPR